MLSFAVQLPVNDVFSFIFIEFSGTMKMHRKRCRESSGFSEEKSVKEEVDRINAESQAFHFRIRIKIVLTTDSRSALSAAELGQGRFFQLNEGMNKKDWKGNQNEKRKPHRSVQFCCHSVRLLDSIERREKFSKSDQISFSPDFSLDMIRTKDESISILLVDTPS